MITIGRLREIRQEKRLSQSDLAKLIGVTDRYVAFLETGDRTPSLKIAKKISEILNKSVEEIFF